MARVAPRTTWKKLPPGVIYVRRYRSSGVLVECSHAFDHQHPTDAWVAHRGDVTELLRYDRGFTQKQVRERMPVGFDSIDYEGTMRCIVCGGDETTTDCFQKSVKMFVEVPEPKAEPKPEFEPQAMLF